MDTRNRNLEMEPPMQQITAGNTAKKIRVLVVDDSAYMRKAIREMLEENSLIQVIGTAHQGLDALEQIELLRPDVVTIDLFMPEMDGVDFTRTQMARSPIPIVVCSSAEVDGDRAIAAIEAGAVEFVRKPTSRALDTVYGIRHDLLQAVFAAAAIPPDRLRVPAMSIAEQPISIKSVAPNGAGTAGRLDAVLIGISTGGPRALRQMLPRFPKEMPVPIVVALHMPVGYTASLARRLNELSALEVVESMDGMELRPGRVILAQAGKHTRLRARLDGQVEVEVSEEPNNLLYCPSVDELLRSGAEVLGSRVLGVIMTGMGNDGTAGAAWIKAQGGLVFAEAETSTVVFGMPRAALEAGVVDRMVDLEDLPQQIMEAAI